MLEADIHEFKDYIASIPDFPQEGVLFHDITPLMADDGRRL